MIFKIFDSPILEGILIGNQICAIFFFFYNLILDKGIVLASAVYGLTTLIITYPAIIIYLIIKLIQKRGENEQ